MQKNFEKNRQVSLQQYVTTAAHHNRQKAKQADDSNADEQLIDTEVPGDSYYKQYGDDEQELQKLFSKD